MLVVIAFVGTAVFAPPASLTQLRWLAPSVGVALLAAYVAVATDVD